MQGFLYKKSGKPLSKEWKKKYVTLMDDGHLIYYPSYNVSIVLGLRLVHFYTLHLSLGTIYLLTYCCVTANLALKNI